MFASTSSLSALVWLWRVALCGLASMVSLPTYGADPATAVPKFAPDVVVYRGSYPGWPWLTSTPSGQLLCVWREGTVHEFSADGRLMLSSSRDSGRTWSVPRTILDVPEVDDRNVALLCLNDNHWIASYNSYTQAGVSRAWVIHTTNAGESWSTPQLVLDEDARTKGAVVRLANGDLVLPYYRGSGEECLLAISTDGGHAWQTVSVPNTPGFLGDEWDLLELPDRRLIGILRNNARPARSADLGWFYKTESLDQGRTWTTPVRTNLQSTRATSPAQIFLHQDKPVVLYANARKVSVVMATTDDPQLITWNIAQQLPCYFYRPDRSPIADGSYPVSVPVSNQQRLIIDYVHDGESKTISGYFVDMSRLFSTGK